MPIRILVTTSSFLDTPGAHVDRLKNTGFEVANERGPLSEQQLLELVGDGNQFDGYICGEDEFSSAVLKAAVPRAKVVSKYGVGLDKIDLAEAERLGIKVTNTPGVNHTTVTELTFGLLLSLVRAIPEQNAFVHNCEWRRLTGTELVGKTIGVMGLGRVGKEVAKRAMAFGMQVLVYNTSWSASHATFVSELNRIYSEPLFSEYPPSIKRSEKDEDLLRQAHFITLHMNLTRDNMYYLNRRRLGICRRGVRIVNVSRGALVDQRALAEAVKTGQVGGYAADVVDPEPIRSDNPLRGLNNVHLTPHVGSRTYDSVVRQGMAALNNLLSVLAPSQDKAA